MKKISRTAIAVLVGALMVSALPALTVAQDEAEPSPEASVAEEVTLATTPDIGELQIEIDKTRAHVAELREHVHSLRIGQLTDQVAVLQAHVDTLTEQHFSLKEHVKNLQARVHAQEKQLDDRIKQLTKEGILD